MHAMSPACAQLPGSIWMEVRPAQYLAVQYVVQTVITPQSGGRAGAAL